MVGDFSTSSLERFVFEHTKCVSIKMHTDFAGNAIVQLRVSVKSGENNC